MLYVEKLLPFDCLNINQVNSPNSCTIIFIRMSLDMQELLLFNCLNFNEKILSGDINSLSNLLVLVSLCFILCFQDGMFKFEIEKEKYGLKPMNCPGHWYV